MSCRLKRAAHLFIVQTIDTATTGGISGTGRGGHECPPTKGPGGDDIRPPFLVSRRVLVVDDNVDAADSAAMLLPLAGQEVRVAYDGPTAVVVAEAFRPQLVLLDIGMPGMDGYDVARRFRDDTGLKPAMLVAMTGWGQEEDRRRSLQAGFDHHPVKPAEPDVLHQLLAGLTGS